MYVSPLATVFVFSENPQAELLAMISLFCNILFSILVFHGGQIHLHPLPTVHIAPLHIVSALAIRL